MSVFSGLHVEFIGLCLEGVRVNTACTSIYIESQSYQGSRMTLWYDSSITYFPNSSPAHLFSQSRCVQQRSYMVDVEISTSAEAELKICSVRLVCIKYTPRQNGPIDRTNTWEGHSCLF